MFVYELNMIEGNSAYLSFHNMTKDSLYKILFNTVSSDKRMFFYVKVSYKYQS